MVAPLIVETYTSRGGSFGVDSSALTLHYLVTGTEDDAQVDAMVAGVIAPYYNGLAYESYDKEHKGGGVWDVTVSYGLRLAQTFSFDTSGGTQKITQSLRSAGVCLPNRVLPDFHNAINATVDSVEGLEAHVPVFNFSEDHYFPIEQVLTGFQRTLFLMTGKKNDAPFRGFAPGECLFEGASGTGHKSGFVGISFKFAALPNVVGLEVGLIGVQSYNRAAGSPAWPAGAPVYTDVTSGLAVLSAGPPQNLPLGTVALDSPAGDAMVAVALANFNQNYSFPKWPAGGHWPVGTPLFWDVTFGWVTNIASGAANALIGTVAKGDTGGATVNVCTLTKKGWDYLEVRYDVAIDANQFTQVPWAVLIHEVYRDDDFSKLRIGT